MRIVTWNVNGIRRVHRDLIRRGKKTWLECLESLEGDIICIQELKTERSMMDPIYVNVPGWRSYFTFPVDKKAYSGVACYVREQFKPLRVETAVCGPAYDRYFELENVEFIGGYPASISTVEARQVDREGRALFLDFGGFVFIGTYCPAGAESEERVAYRRLWWRALSERCERLVGMGRELIMTGDLNVHCEAIDQVEAKPSEYFPENLGPCGTIFYKLLHGSQVHEPLTNLQGSLLSGKEDSGIFIDLSRHFFPEREKMYTCWSVKLAAREGNYGARIDFVLATKGLVPYFTSSNVRPDIHGSDHCPVNAHLALDSKEPHLQISRSSDSSAGQDTNFQTSQRTLSANYFSKIPAVLPEPIPLTSPARSDTSVGMPKQDTAKRKAEPLVKDEKKSQKSISSFFRTSPVGSPVKSQEALEPKKSPQAHDHQQAMEPSRHRPATERTHSIEKRLEVSNAFASLFTKPEVPLCDGHQKPAKLQKTKKKGINQGREFWMCAMPLGDGQCKFWRWRKS